MIYLEDVVKLANQTITELQEAGLADKRVLALGIEINQSYIDYLNEWEWQGYKPHNGVDIIVDGRQIHFASVEDFSTWLAGQL